MKILVISCDKYNDLFGPFHYCMEKYWPNHPEIIYVTESVKNPYYRTECLKAEWTVRVKNAAEKIDDDFILMMCDDVFIREPVNEKRIYYILDSLKEVKDFTNCSFISGVKPRPDLEIKPVEGLEDIGYKPRDNYFNTVNCTLWKKDKLLKCLDGPPINVDKFEWDKTRFHGKYFTSMNQNWPIHWGRENNKGHVAITRGKWAQECVDFFNKENYKIDFTKRGITRGDYW